jgi:hypothetical protein
MYHIAYLIDDRLTICTLPLSGLVQYMFCDPIFCDHVRRVSGLGVIRKCRFVASGVISGSSHAGLHQTRINSKLTRPCPGNIISEFQKYRLPPDPNQSYMFCHPVPHEGRIAIVTDVGMGCGGRGSAGRAELIAGRVLAREWSGSRKTSGAASGRQNRVVLAPVAGVKSAEVRKARPGWQTLIRRRR